MFTNSFSYPNLFNPTSGRCQMKEDYDSIVNRVGCLLKSYTGEQFLFPEYGCTFPDILFQTNNSQNIQKAKTAIIKAIEKYEPLVNASMIVIEDKSTDHVLSLSVTLVLNKDYRRVVGTVEFSFEAEGVHL